MDKQAEARRRFASAFNSTMIKIWRERITLLGVVRSGALYRSVLATKFLVNNDATDVELEQAFLTYGLWQNYGTGREVYRGNPGDIGRHKVREVRRWFDTKYYSSVMNIRDMFAESLGMDVMGVVSNALSSDRMREAVTK